jgi:DNA-binding MarR family transcriptional regulator
LVRRDADATDRRVNRVFLEPKSKQLIARMRKVSHRLNEQILGDLPDPKLEAAATTLDAMKRNLLTYLQATEPA